MGNFQYRKYVTYSYHDQVAEKKKSSNLSESNQSDAAASGHVFTREWAAVSSHTPQIWKRFTNPKGPVFRNVLDCPEIPGYYPQHIYYEVVNVAEALTTSLWLSLISPPSDGLPLFPLEIPFHGIPTTHRRPPHRRPPHLRGIFPAPEWAELKTPAKPRYGRALSRFSRNNMHRHGVNVFSLYVQTRVIDYGVGGDEDLERFKATMDSLPKRDSQLLLRNALTYKKNIDPAKTVYSNHVAEEFSLAKNITQRLGCARLTCNRMATPAGGDVTTGPPCLDVALDPKPNHQSSCGATEERNSTEISDVWYYNCYPRNDASPIRMIRVTQQNSDVDLASVSDRKSEVGCRSVTRRSQRRHCVTGDSSSRSRVFVKSRVASDPNPEDGCYLDLINRKVSVMTTSNCKQPTRVKGVTTSARDQPSMQDYEQCLLELESIEIEHGGAKIECPQVKLFLVNSILEHGDHSRSEIQMLSERFLPKHRLLPTHFTFDKLRSP